jgi:hypothetical protein
MIWDREHWNPAEPNSRVVTACNLILIEMARHSRAAIERWTSRPPPAVSRQHNQDTERIRQHYTNTSTWLVSQLQRIRDTGRVRGTAIPEGDYQLLGLALYFLWREGAGGAGLSSQEIGRIQASLGLTAQATGNVQSFEDIFSHAILTGLQPDQIAQVLWLVRTGQQHAFLIGRLHTGEWFLSDQGPSPAAEFRAPSLADLRTTVRLAADTGRYWLYTGTMTDYLNRGGVLPGWTGVMRLGPHTGVEAKAQALVAPGTRLGEVDAGYTTIGNVITAGAFVTRRYSLTDAQAALPAMPAAGGLIVEMPQGVFSLYTTATVSSANVTQASLDAADSVGMLLASHTFFHAWLILSTSAGSRGSWFRVY